ncbi:hypothetical protein [Streptomyces sp. NPDC008141]|uniref:hypothetical protein n=1 Tax=Streptomyces sp. NPDC008141 TaxID=3364815 RepID=UPI0036F03485
MNPAVVEPGSVTARPTKLSRDALRYPRRGGSQTEWLTERQALAAAGHGARSEAAGERGAHGVPAAGQALSEPNAAFERGVAALAQYTARAGSLTVPRARVEQLDDSIEVKLGVFLSSPKPGARSSADSADQRVRAAAVCRPRRQ